jgi:cytochrome b subunit of formate dehydrogenase
MLNPRTIDAPFALAPSEPRVARHALAERLFHWILAASFLTLIVSAFGPILGWKVDWVAIHWIAGIVMTLAILFHVGRALLSLDFWSMMVDRTDLRNLWRGLVCQLSRRGPLPGRPGKYELGQKLFHWGIAGVAAGLVATGLLMLAKLDTPFWQRDPYWLSETTWGIVYTIHGICATLAVPMIILHVYFVLRPEHLHLLRTMMTGWETRREYLDDTDTSRWRPEELKE